MQKSTKNQLTIFAGPNGSGKSSLYYSLSNKVSSLKETHYINPDEIKIKHQTSDINAGKIAIKQMNDHLNNRQSYVRETTFSQNIKGIIKDIERAKKAGYKVNLVFVGVDKPMININRVRNRVKNGGHDIPNETIKNRWFKSMDNINKTLPLFDRAYIFDNSQNKSKLIAKYELGIAKKISIKVPDWYLKNVYQNTEVEKNLILSNKISVVSEIDKQLKNAKKQTLKEYTQIKESITIKLRNYNISMNEFNKIKADLKQKKKIGI